MVQVISYWRYSRMVQGKGDSFRRQSQMAEDWCSKNGYKLDTSLRFQDRGVSAFRGVNAESGALAALIGLVKDGTLKPGTILILEALDRLTRQDLSLSVPFFLQLLKLGLVIVTLHDGKTWTSEGMRDQSDFILAVLLLARGHGESEYKSKRVRDAYTAGREARSNKPFGSAPGWLTRAEKTSPWTVVLDKAESVRRVFELAAAGYGSPAISKKANAERWPLPVRVTSQTKSIWHSRMPGQILRNSAVCGTHEFRLRTYEANALHWKGTATGIVVPDFYPRIISDELWYRAQAGVDSRVKLRRRDEHFYNIWSGLLYCGQCGASMQRKIEHRGIPGGQIVCSGKMAGVTKCKPASVRLTDPTLLRDVTIYAASALGVQEEAGKELAMQLERVQLRLADLDAAVERVGAALVATGDALPGLLRQATDLSKQRVELVDESDSLKQRLATFEPNLFDDAYARKVTAALYLKTDEAKGVRAECNQRLLRAVERIWLWPYDVALVKYKSGHMQSIPLPLKRATDSYFYLNQHFAGQLVPPGHEVVSGSFKPAKVR